MDYQKKIFALEGEWERTPEDKASVIELLRFLKNTVDIDYFHRRAATQKEVFYYLSRRKDFKKYDIIYLAFHGEKGLIAPNQDLEITLEELVPHRKFFERKILHISSCSTLKYSKDELKEKKNELGVKVLSGYSKDVDWIDSTLLDIAYFTWWQEYKTRGKNLQDKLQEYYPGLYERLGFIMV